MKGILSHGRSGFFLHRPSPSHRVIVPAGVKYRVPPAKPLVQIRPLHRDLCHRSTLQLFQPTYCKIRGLGLAKRSAAFHSSAGARAQNDPNQPQKTAKSPWIRRILLSLLLALGVTGLYLAYVIERVVSELEEIEENEENDLGISNELLEELMEDESKLEKAIEEANEYNLDDVFDESIVTVVYEQTLREPSMKTHITLVPIENTDQQADSQNPNKKSQDDNDEEDSPFSEQFEIGFSRVPNKINKSGPPGFRKDEEDVSEAELELTILKPNSTELEMAFHQSSSPDQFLEEKHRVTGGLLNTRVLLIADSKVTAKEGEDKSEPVQFLTVYDFVNKILFVRDFEEGVIYPVSLRGIILARLNEWLGRKEVINMFANVAKALHFQEFLDMFYVETELSLAHPLARLASQEELEKNYNGLPGSIEEKDEQVSAAQRLQLSPLVQQQFSTLDEGQQTVKTLKLLRGDHTLVECQLMKIPNQANIKLTGTQKELLFKLFLYECFMHPMAQRQLKLLIHQGWIPVYFRSANFPTSEPSTVEMKLLNFQQRRDLPEIDPNTFDFLKFVGLSPVTPNPQAAESNLPKASLLLSQLDAVKQSVDSRADVKLINEQADKLQAASSLVPKYCGNLDTARFCLFPAAEFDFLNRKAVALLTRQPNFGAIKEETNQFIKQALQRTNFLDAALASFEYVLLTGDRSFLQNIHKYGSRDSRIKMLARIQTDENVVKNLMSSDDFHELQKGYILEFCQGELYVLEGDLDAALEVYNKILEKSPYFTPAYLRLMMILQAYSDRSPLAGTAFEVAKCLGLPSGTSALLDDQKKLERLFPSFF